MTGPAPRRSRGSRCCPRPAPTRCRSRATSSPTARSDELPSVTVLRPLALRTLMMATSLVGSAPTRSAGRASFSPSKVTVIRCAPFDDVVVREDVAVAAQDHAGAGAAHPLDGRAEEPVLPDEPVGLDRHDGRDRSWPARPGCPAPARAACRFEPGANGHVGPAIPVGRSRATMPPPIKAPDQRHHQTIASCSSRALGDLSNSTDSAMRGPRAVPNLYQVLPWDRQTSATPGDS